MVTASADLAIRLRRAAFNRALAEADLGAIGPILAPTAILVAGTDSAILSGRKAQLAAWKCEFATAERTVYTRTPDTIQVSTVAPVALKQGRWQGVAAAGALPARQWHLHRQMAQVGRGLGNRGRDIPNPCLMRSGAADFCIVRGALGQ